ncbi:YtxH domain-containing protein [Pedobacter sp. MC2016-15]|uniref:YtxH domain-containing protein n=1 Tax=Pedobacter sp. MC2016-15 TaxID=2994473 RepID=UPI002246E6A3|nr:YtxH domain-containing protein [Pedobacter sp. MC2016-15]MCX2477486.1 YtxH domain-containing protein [Pedobacter sp. MC2016-15]
MNYKKLLNDQLHSDTDKTPVVVALLAGLAVGAALGVLFAPASGTETRDLIADKSKDLADSAKDKLQTYKEKIKSGADQLTDTAKDKYQTYSGKLQDGVDELSDLKDIAVESVKSKFNRAENLADNIKTDVENA